MLLEPKRFVANIMRWKSPPTCFLHQTWLIYEATTDDNIDLNEGSRHHGNIDHAGLVKPLDQSTFDTSSRAHTVFGIKDPDPSVGQSELFDATQSGMETEWSKSQHDEPWMNPSLCALLREFRYMISYK